MRASERAAPAARKEGCAWGLLGVDGWWWWGGGLSAPSTLCCRRCCSTRATSSSASPTATRRPASSASRCPGRRPRGRSPGLCLLSGRAGEGVPASPGMRRAACEAAGSGCRGDAMQSCQGGGGGAVLSGQPGTTRRKGSGRATSRIRCPEPRRLALFGRAGQLAGRESLDRASAGRGGRCIRGTSWSCRSNLRPCARGPCPPTLLRPLLPMEQASSALASPQFPCGKNAPRFPPRETVSRPARRRARVRVWMADSRLDGHRPGQAPTVQRTGGLHLRQHL